MKKAKVLLIVVFAALLGVAVWFSSSKDSGAVMFEKTTALTGIITSEKENFFKDPRVQEIFKKNGLDVQYTKMSSGAIAEAKTLEDLHNADFVFPSGIQTSEKVRTNFKSSQANNVFYSPMIIATWTPIVDILRANGVTKKVGKYEAIDMESFMKLAENGTRWKDLKHSEEYPVNKVVLVYSSNTQLSNAAKMYLTLNSYILNQSNVVSSKEEVDKVLPTLRKIILAQGNRENSSTNMMTDYMGLGMGKVPMMFAYESEFLENVFKANKVKAGMKLMYPTPTVFTKHVLTSLNPKAQLLVDLFKTNKELQQVAVEYGFRFEGSDDLVKKAKAVGVDIPESVLDVIDPPNFDVLEYMSQQVEKK